MNRKALKKYLAGLLALLLLGTLCVPGSFAVFAAETGVEAEEGAEIPEEYDLAEAADSSAETAESSPEDGGSSYGSEEAERPDEPAADSPSEYGTDLPDEGYAEEGVEEALEMPDEEAEPETLYGNKDPEDPELPHTADPFPKDGTFRSFVFENKKLRVEALLQYEDALPEETSFFVRPVLPSTRGYAYEEYMKALNLYAAWNDGLDDPDRDLFEQADELLSSLSKPYYAAENTLLYDVIFSTPVKVGKTTKMVEVTPAKGLVKLTFSFKKDQLLDLKVAEREDISMMYLPFAEEVRAAYDTTAKIEDPRAEDLELEEMPCSVKLFGLDDVEKDEVSFISLGASVFSMTSRKVVLPEQEAAEEGVEEETLQTPKERILEAVSARSQNAEDPGADCYTDEEGNAHAVLSATKILFDSVEGELAREELWPKSGFSFRLDGGEEGYVLPEEREAQATYAEPRAAFGETVFTEAGTYTLTVSEVIPDEAVEGIYRGILYDPDPHTAEVTVEESGDGLYVSDISYDTLSEDGRLYVVNTTFGVEDAGTLYVRKLESVNGKESGTYADGAVLRIVDAETGKTAVDPVTQEEAVWETQEDDALICLEKGSYLLTEVSVPEHRKQYWTGMEPFPFRIENGKAWVESTDHELVEIQVLTVYNDFDEERYLRDSAASDPGTSDQEQEDEGTNTTVETGSGEDPEDEYEGPARAPEGSDTGVYTGKVEHGKTEKGSGSSSSSSSSGSTKNNGSTRTVTVSTGGGSGTATTRAAGSSSGTVRTVTVSTGTGTEGDGTVRVATVHVAGADSDDTEGTLRTNADGTVTRVYPDGREERVDPDTLSATPTGTATVITEGQAPEVTPRTTDPAPTGDFDGARVPQLLAAAFAALLLLFAAVRRRRA